MGFQAGGKGAISDGQHAGSEQGRVCCVVNGNGGYGDACRHLHNAQERVLTGEGRDVHGHADDRQRGHGGHHAR